MRRKICVPDHEHVQQLRLTSQIAVVVGFWCKAGTSVVE
jgi:hypothetical protein